MKVESNQVTHITVDKENTSMLFCVHVLLLQVKLSLVYRDWDLQDLGKAAELGTWHLTPLMSILLASRAKIPKQHRGMSADLKY